MEIPSTKRQISNPTFYKFPPGIVSSRTTSSTPNVKNIQWPSAPRCRPRIPHHTSLLLLLLSTHPNTPTHLRHVGSSPSISSTSGHLSPTKLHQCARAIAVLWLQVSCHRRSPQLPRLGSRVWVYISPAGISINPNPAISTNAVSGSTVKGPSVCWCIRSHRPCSRYLRRLRREGS